MPSARRHTSACPWARAATRALSASTTSAPPSCLSCRLSPCRVGRGSWMRCRRRSRRGSPFTSSCLSWYACMRAPMHARQVYASCMAVVGRCLLRRAHPGTRMSGEDLAYATCVHACMHAGRHQYMRIRHTRRTYMSDTHAMQDTSVTAHSHQDILVGHTCQTLMPCKTPLLQRIHTKTYTSDIHVRHSCHA